jgi:hypothetical protein
MDGGRDVQGVPVARRAARVDAGHGRQSARGPRRERLERPAESAYYEAPKAYLHRVLRRGHAVEDEHVIPYRGLIALYVEVTTPRPVGDDVRRCACGCGSPVRGRHRYATGACRVRALRQRRVSAGADEPEGPENAQQRQGVFRYISADPVPGYPCNSSAAEIGSPAVEADTRAHRGDGPVGAGGPA